MQQASFLNLSLFDIESLILEQMDAITRHHSGKMPSEPTQVYMKVLRVLGLIIDERGEAETLSNSIIYYSYANFNAIILIDQADETMNMDNAVDTAHHTGTMVDTLNSAHSLLKAFNNMQVKRTTNHLPPI